jgi:molecular chaperone DnaK (HSP70)
MISNRTRTRIVNVTSKTYGIGCLMDGKDMVSNLIFANTALPAKVSENFSTVSNNQKSVAMQVYESDVTDQEADKEIEPRFAVKLEEKPLPLSKNYPKGTPVEVVFEIDDEGIFSVHAEVDKTDNVDFKLSIKGVRDETQLAMAKAQIDKMSIE